MKIYDGSSATAQRTRNRISVGIGELAVTTDDDRLISNGLGSCVGVALTDSETGTRGLVHVMLPAEDGQRARTPGKFADTGIVALIEEMEAEGADRESLCARIAGGSDMLEFSNVNGGVGQRNISAVRATLDEHDIPIVGEDVGGDYGRSLDFADSNELVIKTANGYDHTI